METEKSFSRTSKFSLTGVAFLALLLFLTVPEPAFGEGGGGGGSCNECTPELCDDGDDNDGDGKTDCVDENCKFFTVCGDPDQDGHCDRATDLPDTATCTLTGGGVGGVDNCPGISNPEQDDTNEDGIGDACDSACSSPIDCGDDDADGICDFDPPPSG